jgi:hypothetical protein
MSLLMPMKPIPEKALIGQISRQGKKLGQPLLAAVNAGIKDGDLHTQRPGVER